MLKVSETRAAVLFLNGDAEQTEGTQLGPEIARKLIALVDFFGARRDLVGREIANSVANGIRRLAEIKIENTVRVRNHRRSPRGS